MRFWTLLGIFCLVVTAGCGTAPSDEAPAAQQEPAGSPAADPESTDAPDSQPSEEPAGTPDEPAANPNEPVASTPPESKEAPKAAAATRPAPPRRPDRPAAPAKNDEPPAGPHPGLLNPAEAAETAPNSFRVKFETTKGDFVVQVNRDWAPRGADRFYNLVKIGFLNDAAFFRVIEGFMVQFGITGDPAVNQAWEKTDIEDDPVTQSNQRGYITFATRGPNTRTTQLFINFGNNERLDAQGFTPFGKVVEGMNVVDSLYSGYGEGAPYGRGPSQALIGKQGNEYLKANFPNLDYIKRAYVM